MQIIIARHSGVCFGVEKALETVNKYAGRSEKVYTLGSLIHNKQVVEKLEREGIHAIENLDRLDDGIVIVRSHGVAPEVYNKARDRGIQIVDATCPFVKKIQNKVKEYYNKGYQIIIIGDKDHPEVKGVNGWCDYSAIIVNGVQEAAAIGHFEKICVVAQTTITHRLWNDVNEVMENKGGEAVFFNTICNATHLRQQAAIELAVKVDAMIVIGGFHSSNTRKLYKLSKEICENTYQVETAADLPVDKLKNVNIVGVTAGASTPDWIIKEVVGRMSNEENANVVNQKEEINEEIKEERKVDIPENSTAIEESKAGAEENEATADDKETAAEQEETMDAMDDTMVSLKQGDTVKGKVIAVKDEEVVVSLGYKADGIITREELTGDPTLSPSDIVREGDEIEVFVKKLDDGEGNVLLSKKKVDVERGWAALDESFQAGSPVEGKVVEEVKGGLISIVNGIKGFIPASHIDVGYVENLAQFVDQVLPLKVIELNRRRGKLVLSRKVLLEEEREKRKQEVLNSINAGDRIRGEVKRLTGFGAFVDIGGIDGLIHISEISWNRIGHPSEVLNVGDEIEVEVLGVDPENERVSLGYKQTQPHPWDDVTNKYKVGEIVEGKIVRLVDFGAFVELETGIEGLVHVSQIAYHHVEKPQDELKENQMVKVKILDIKPEERRISLSIKEAAERPKKQDRKGKETLTVHTDDEPAITIGDLVGDILKEDNEE